MSDTEVGSGGARLFSAAVYSHLKHPFSYTDTGDVRRAIVFLLAAFVLVACQGSSGGFYDEQAKDEALRAAKSGPFDGNSDVVVSVGSAHERDECPQAPSPDAGPCLNVAVTTELPARNLSGKKVGLRVHTEWDFFVWLEKRGDGRWKVTHTSYRPKGAAVD